jgi:hypothetical protein
MADVAAAQPACSSAGSNTCQQQQDNAGAKDWPFPAAAAAAAAAAGDAVVLDRHCEGSRDVSTGGKGADISATAAQHSLLLAADTLVAAVPDSSSDPLPAAPGAAAAGAPGQAQLLPADAVDVSLAGGNVMLETAALAATAAAGEANTQTHTVPVRADLCSLLTSNLAQRGSADLPACAHDGSTGLHVAVGDSGAQVQDAASSIQPESCSATSTTACAGSSPEQKHSTHARADLRSLLSLRLQRQGDQQQQQQQRQAEQPAHQVDEEDDSIWIDSTSSSAGSAYGAWMIGYGCESPKAPGAAAAAAGEPGLLGAAASADESDELADMLQLLGV